MNVYDLYSDIDSDGNEYYRNYECKEARCKEDCPNSYKDGIIFEWLPPVLHISIPNLEISEKLSFPKEINLAKYVRENSIHDPHDHQYTIFAFYCGHGDENILYANPKLKGKWYKFIDEVVYPVSEEEAMMINFKGGTKVVNMLTYIRKSDV